MKAPYRYLSTLLLVLFLSAASSAQSDSYNYKLQLLTTNTDPGKYIIGSDAWTKFIKRAVVLDEIEGNTELGKPTLVFPGYMKPMAYFDPRPSRHQVQYIEAGLKFDLTVRAAAGDSYRMEARAQQSKLSPHPKLKERRKSCLFESTTFLKHGQTAVFLSLRGPLAAKHLKELYPSASIEEDTYFIMAVSLD